jgi:hypothetical protein
MTSMSRAVFAVVTYGSTAPERMAQPAAWHGRIARCARSIRSPPVRQQQVQRVCERTPPLIGVL